MHIYNCPYIHRQFCNKCFKSQERKTNHSYFAVVYHLPPLSLERLGWGKTGAFQIENTPQLGIPGVHTLVPVL